MFKGSILIGIMSLGCFSAIAAEIPITGNVQSRCVITTDSSGVYGNPNAYTLTTSASDGGAKAVIRIDVTLADAYKAEITAPSSFSSSPSLNDTVTWTGDTVVKAISDATGMAGYETGKV